MHLCHGRELTAALSKRTTPRMSGWRDVAERRHRRAAYCLIELITARPEMNDDNVFARRRARSILAGSGGVWRTVGREFPPARLTHRSILAFWSFGKGFVSVYVGFDDFEWSSTIMFNMCWSSGYMNVTPIQFDLKPCLSCHDNLNCSISQSHVYYYVLSCLWEMLL